MHISVQFPAEEALTDEEKSRVHTTGSHQGTFFNSVFIQTSPVKHEDGTYDFTEAYVDALRQFLKEEPRAVEGKSLGFSFAY